MFKVIVENVEEAYFETEEEAWEYRDKRLDEGFTEVRITNLPTRGFCVLKRQDSPDFEIWEGENGK